MKNKFYFLVCFFCFVFIFIVIYCMKMNQREEHKKQFDSTEQIIQNPDELTLSSMLHDYTSIFPHLLERDLNIVTNILDHKQEFLTDLANVLANDTDNLFIIADKQHFLDPDYEPADLITLPKGKPYAINRSNLFLRQPVEQALVIMAEQAKIDGITLLVSSTYRSYDYQKMIYERNVREMGKEAADRESAAPGTSQHQLGVAIDFGSISDDFATTKAGIWMKQNAHNFGFSLSFPEEYESVTGYRWESWHYRYIGTTATAFQKKWFNDIQQYMIEFIHAWKLS